MFFSMDRVRLHPWLCASSGPRHRALALVGLTAILGALNAQNLPPTGVMYSCNNGASKLKITQCSSGSNVVCEVQFYGNETPPKPTGSARLSREQLTGALRTCVLPNGQPAIVTVRPSATARPAAPQASNAAFKVGDIAMAYSMFGWIQVRILEIRGNQYRIQYMDRSNMWVKASNLRRPTAVATRSGAGSVPPGGATKSDAGSCAGKLDGTFADQLGLLSIVFRSGKATVTQPLAGTYEADCRIQGNRIVLQGARAKDNLVLTRKDDRTLEDRDAGTITRKD
jgi:hypothetical protein